MVTKDFSGIRNNGKLPDASTIAVPGDIGDLLGDYIESTTSLLEDLEGSALSYEEGGDREENAASMRRILHKMKGEAGMVGIEDMSNFCHQVESVFEELCEDKRVDMVLRFKDWVSSAMECLSRQTV